MAAPDPFPPPPPPFPIYPAAPAPAPQVEDMLKRSFAEFHAQRAQPDKLAAVARGQRQLDAYKAAPWPDCYLGCSRRVPLGRAQEGVRMGWGGAGGGGGLRGYVWVAASSNCSGCGQPNMPERCTPPSPPPCWALQG